MPARMREREERGREGGERERERQRGMCVGCSASMGLSRPIECKQKTEQFYANYAKHHTPYSNQ